MHFVMTAALAFLVGMLSTPAPGTARVQEDSESATTYRENCASCHGADGRGDTDIGRQLGVPDLRSEEIQGRTDEQMMESMAEIPVHSQFGEESIRRGLMHIRTLAADQDR